MRKDYFGNLGWRIHLWAEKDGPENDDDVAIVAFGPNGSRLGTIWVEHHEVLPIVDELDKLIDVDLPYEEVTARVMRLMTPPQESRAEQIVNSLLEGEDFDPRDYLMSAPSPEAFVQELGALGWEPGDLESHWGMEFKRSVEINTIPCNVKLYVHPEFPHEAIVDVQANYTDDNGFEHWDRVDQNIYWEMQTGESVGDYVARMSDDMARKLTVPDVYEPETIGDEDWAADR